MNGKQEKKKSVVDRAVDLGLGWWRYFNQGVWEDSSHNWKVATVKTLNLSMRAFLNSRLWVRAAALTYNTILAIVPALALVFAICRGFGFQNMLETQLLRYFPAQSQAITTGLKFVDSYLNSYSEGLFVGAGIVFLLWTLFSLMSNVEEAFNEAWGIHHGRTIWRKVTDYTTIFFILPVILICSSGINIVMSTTLQQIIPWPFLQGAVSWVLDLVSLVLIWLFFTGTYMMIPNTHVKPQYALIAGFFAGLAFTVLEWLFVSGQLYVSRYNAIYGSFSFLPLLLIWLQLVWLITLAGAAVCYALQNIYNISYIDKVDNISVDYRQRVALAVMWVISKSWREGTKAPTVSEIAVKGALPANLVSATADRLLRSGLVVRVIDEKKPSDPGFMPAFDFSPEDSGLVLERLRNMGDHDFIPGFHRRYPEINAVMDAINKSLKEKHLPTNTKS